MKNSIQENSMRIIVRALLAIVLISLLSTDSAWATWNDVGYSPRGISMGLAQTAVATDSSAIEFNPAGLVTARERWELSGGDIWFQYSQVGYFPVLRVNGVDQNYWFTEAATIGIMVPIGKRVTFGAQLINPSDITLAIVVLHGPGFERYQPQRQPLGGLGIGIKITDKFSVGVTQMPTVHFNANELPIDVGAIVAGAGLPLGEPNTDIVPQLEIDAISGGSYSFGALLSPVKQLSLGFAYKYRNGSKLYMPVFLPPGLLPETTLVIESNTSVQPTQMLFGIGLFPNENMTIAFDMVYSVWSREKPFARSLSSDPNFMNSPYPDVELVDTWDPHFGFEWRDKLWGKLSRADYSVRAGYSFSNTPYPPASGENTTYDNDAHFYSGGFSLGYTPKKRLGYIGFDYFFQYIDLIPRTHRDLDRNPAVIVTDGYSIFYGAGITMKM